MNQYSISELQAYIGVFYPGRNLLLTPYAYPLTFDPLTHATTPSQQLQISANADFCLTGMSYQADLAGAAQTVSNKPVLVGRILVTDTGSNEQFTQGAVPLETVAANGNSNAIGPATYPRMVSGRSVLQVQLFSDEAANDYTVVLSFMGLLVRAYSDAGRLGQSF